MLPIVYMFLYLYLHVVIYMLLTTGFARLYISVYIYTVTHAAQCVEVPSSLIEHLSSSLIRVYILQSKYYVHLQIFY